MKNFIIFILLIGCLAGGVFYINKNNKTSADVQNKVSDTKIASELNSLAMKVLYEAENRNSNAMNQYINQMLRMGVTAMSTPHIAAKQTPNCPPIEMELNWQNLQGGLCAKFGYEYKGKEYWVGYCK